MQVVNLCYLYFTRLSDDMSTNGKWPMNQPLEFRITGLDKAEVIQVGENVTKIIRPPSLSFLTEVEGHPEYDVAIFLGLHYFPGWYNRKYDLYPYFCIFIYFHFQELQMQQNL